MPLTIAELNQQLGDTSATPTQTPNGGLSNDQLSKILEMEAAPKETPKSNYTEPQVMYKDGQAYTVSPDKIDQALAQGYTPETHQQLIQRDEQHKIEQEGVMGSLKAGVKSFANQAAFGALAPIMEHGETEDEKIRRETEEQEHQLARGIGGTGGFLGSLAIGGPLFRGAGIAGGAVERLITEGGANLLERAATEGGEKVGAELATKAAENVAQASLTRRLAGSMANQAVQGAIISSPQALAQAIIGNPAKAAETLSWGLGLGMFTGGASELVSSGTKAMENAAKDGITGAMDSQKFKDAAAKFAVGGAFKLAGFNKKILNGMSPSRIADTANLLFDSGIMETAEGKRAIGDMADVLHDKVGKQIGEARNQLDNLLQQTSDRNYPIRQAGPTTTEFISQLTKELDHPELRFEHNDAAANAKDLLIRDAQKLGDKYGNLTFKDIQDFTESLRGSWTNQLKKYFAQSGGKGVSTITPLDLMKGNAYMAARNYADMVGDRVVQTAQDAGIDIKPGFIQDFMKARKDYSILLDLEKAQTDLAKREISNRNVGLTDFLHAGSGVGSLATAGVGGTLGAMAGHATGIPGAGFVGGYIGSKIGRVAGAPLDIMLKHWMENKGLLFATNLARKASKDGAQVFSAVLTQEALQRARQTMNGIGNSLIRVSQRSSPLTANTTLNPLQHLLQTTTGLSTDKQKQSLLIKLNNIAANPQTVSELTSHVGGALSQFSPELAESYHAQVVKQLGYLVQNAPKMAEQTPFAPKPEIAIDPSEWKDFMDKAEVALNPMAVMHHWENGTLTDNHIDALNNVWSSMKQDMVSEIIKAYSNNTNLVLPYAKRASLYKILGSDIDDNVSAADISQAYAQLSGRQQQSNQSGGKTKAKIENTNGTTQLPFSAMSQSTNENA